MVSIELYGGIARFALLLHATCNTGDNDNEHDEDVADDGNDEEDNV